MVLGLYLAYGMGVEDEDGSGGYGFMMRRSLLCF